MNELIELNGDKYELKYDVALKFATYEAQIKKIKEFEENLRDQLKKTMEEKGIKSLKSDYIDIIYVDEFDTIRLDTAQLKEKYKEIYDECSKITHTNSSIKIKVKHDIDEFINGTSNN